MSDHNQSIFLRALKNQRGQVLPWVAFMMLVLLGIGAFALDIGHAFYCYRELQAATDAAALAGAQSLNSASPTAIATSFSAVAGGSNTNGNLPGVSMVPNYPKYACISGITQAACVGPEDANAIQVKEQAIIPTFFAKVLGINQMTLSATSTAAIVGAKNQITNIAIVLDTTASMQTVDSNCSPTGGSAERVVCAEQGVQVLLQDLSPCSTALGCGTVTNGVATNALDQVAIFTFPNVTSGTASNDYNCSGANPSIPAYSLPLYNATTYPPNASGVPASTASYQITPFLSDYKSGDTGTTLVTGSDLSMATGAGTSSGSPCAGMQAPGGDGTYYAGVIYAAQAALTAQAATELAANSNANPQNIMIILTDGEANAKASKMATTDASGNPIGTANTFPAGGGATSYLTNYPSTYNQCQQAVAAANYAKAQSTLVYTIAYGSESSGCTTDTSGPQAGITPCMVMSEMASPNTTDPATGAPEKVFFFSDYNESGSGSSCVSPGSSVTNINSIFQQIAGGLLTVRLVPETVWPAS
jgi:Flp pilus assembly protein TadG